MTTWNNSTRHLALIRSQNYYLFLELVKPPASFRGFSIRTEKNFASFRRMSDAFQTCFTIGDASVSLGNAEIDFQLAKSFIRSD